MSIQSVRLLVADIGGTNSRFDVFSDGASTGVLREYVNSDYPSFDHVLNAYLRTLDEPPTAAAFAVAGPVFNQAVTMTNLGWTVSAVRLKESLSLACVVVLNDFEALAWATLTLQQQDILEIGSGTVVPEGNRIVIGPGTGLGMAALVSYVDRDGSIGWTSVAGEGGHVSLAVATPEESAIVQRVIEKRGHCSAEWLISGAGLPRIAEALGYAAAPPELLTAGAIAGEPEARHVLNVFSNLLATVAADQALSFGAFGGVFLAGGILPKVSGWLADSEFRSRFEHKGRHSDYLAKISTRIIMCEYPALSGLYEYMRRH